MSHLVHLSIDDGIALITIDNPPVNALSHAVIGGLKAALGQAQAAGVIRVVLTGTGKNFATGEDVNELSDVINSIERFEVPVVAAINGKAMGGGVELALACTARISAPEATFSFAEVTLGLVPSAGATQRLPRLVGLKNALSMICEGKVISAAQAEKIGLVDYVSENPAQEARCFSWHNRPSTGMLRGPVFDEAIIKTARQQASKRSPHQTAPQKAIDLVELSCSLPLSEGLAREGEAFLELKDSEQAGALRHVYFAEQAAIERCRVHGADLRSAVVVGGGNMGAGIAYALAGAGINVALVEANDAAMERARANITKLYQDAVDRGKSTAEKAKAEQSARFTFHVGYSGLPAVDIAIEAVFEDLKVKQTVFAALDANLPTTTLLATNTSYLDVNKFADVVRNPSRLLGLHFFSPAHVMRLLEIVKANETSPETLAAALRLAGRLNKIAVLAGVCDGFIGNRILTQYRQTCDIMLIEGALPAQIDAAMRGFGMAMGPYEVQDLSGLDIAYANRKRLGWKTKAGFRYIPIADRVVEETARLGRKTNAGWYDYDEGKAIPSPLVDSIVIEESKRAGLQRRAFSDEEIVARAVTSMVEEGRHILEEGIAGHADDIDLVMIHGYGFPRWRGGPMYWANSIGLSEIRRRLGYADQQ